MFCIQLSGFKYCYITVTIWYQWFVCTHIWVLAGATTPARVVHVEWQWRSTPHSPNLQISKSLAFRLVNDKSMSLVGGVLPLCRDAVGVFYSLSWLGSIHIVISIGYALPPRKNTSLYVAVVRRLQEKLCFQFYYAISQRQRRELVVWQ